MHDSLKQIGLIIAEIVIFVVVLAVTYGIIAYTLVALQVVHFNDAESANTIEPYQATLLDYFPLLVGSLIGIWVVHILIFKRSIRFPSLRRNSGIRQLAFGFLLGFVLVGLGFLILWILGWLTIDKVAFNPYLFFGFLLFFSVQSTVEELMVRSFLLPTIGHRLNIIAGILITSLLFTLLHADNPNVTIISLVNIFLAGVLLGTLFIKYGQIWAPIGLHIGWNFFQGSFFGFEVSGLGVYSYIDSRETGNDWFTGGPFGLEGSLLVTIMMTLVIILIWQSGRHQFSGRYLSSPPEDSFT